MKRLGILTGGGDCPGLNAVIRAVVKKCSKNGWEVLGILDGWKGLIEGNVTPLVERDISGILPKGGTILGTSRTNPFKDQKNVDSLLANIKKFKLDSNWWRRYTRSSSEIIQAGCSSRRCTKNN